MRGGFQWWKEAQNEIARVSFNFNDFVDHDLKEGQNRTTNEGKYSLIQKNEFRTRYEIG